MLLVLFYRGKVFLHLLLRVSLLFGRRGVRIVGIVNACWSEIRESRKGMNKSMGLVAAMVGRRHVAGGGAVGQEWSEGEISGC